MDRKTLARLEALNQIKLTDTQKEDVLSFFAKREAELTTLDEIDTAKTEPMVHVMLSTIALREDEEKVLFSREELQLQAPVTDAGYWCVPRVIE